MTDREKVIKALEYLNWYFTQDDGSADKNAVKAWEVLIREQEPVKPKKEDAWPGMITICGACGAQIPMPGGWRYNYCPTCWKKVKWDATD